MKVLHVVHGYFPESGGGIERYLQRVLPAQRDAGATVTLLTGSMVPWEQCGLECWQEHGLDMVRLHRDDLFFDHHVKAWHPGVEQLVAQFLARERFDLVHVHQWIRLTSNLVELAEAQGIATVVTLHDAYPTCPRAFRIDRDGQSCARPLSVASCLTCVPRYGHEPERELAEGIELFRDQMRSEVLRARSVLVASEAAADLIASNLDVPRARFVVLPLPHAPRLPARQKPVPVPPAPAALRIGYFGLLARHKGVNTLLDAFAALCQQPLPRPAELHLFGESETPEFLAQARARVHGLPATFHGAYSGESLAAAKLHIAVFPSLAFECFSLVLDEAFELGLPVVVSDVGALSRRAGAAAVRVPPGDAVALQRALAELLHDGARIDRLAAHIPPAPPPLLTHVAALASIYATAVATPPRVGVPVVDPLRRAAFVLRQRESALGRITPAGGPR